MIFDGRPIREITIDDLRGLVTDRTAEDKNLEFKRAAYLQTDAGTKELIKDVTAFANSEGGYIIIGISENGDGRATEFFNVLEPEQVRRSIIDRCLHRIEPRLRNIDVGIFEVDGNSILVIYLPESDQVPHCAKPDAEHHYFWKRYEDGVKLMTTVEIRESFSGDRVGLELAELRREMNELRRERTMSREIQMEINEGNLFDLETKDAFFQYIDDHFMSLIGDRPYYRLCATPIPVNQINLRGRSRELLSILQNPPVLRTAGWDITPLGDFHHTAIGLICDRTDFRHLRLLWNGHLEFWTAADDSSFHWTESYNTEPPWRILFPFAIIEPAACFVQTMINICRIAGYAGEVKFGSGLYNIRGQFLLPHSPDSIRYLQMRNWMDQPNGPTPFNSQNLIVRPINIQVQNLPNTVVWNLVSQVYYQFGYMNNHIPFFDADHRCTIGRGEGAAGQ